jgi:predicted metal-dependent phosphotriesterase family hydrolase
MSLSSVMTVLGPVDNKALGLTITHEHLFSDLLREYRSDGLLDDLELAIAELNLFREAGGSTVVECTTMGGRNPEGLRAAAQRTGVHIVMGCGYYRQPYLDTRWLDEIGTSRLASVIVDECSAGVGDTGVRAGIIGEIGCDRYITSAEERVFRACARAHHQTGLSITTHAARWPVGIMQLDLLAEEGVSADRVIIGHCDTVPDVAYHECLARRGAFVQFDTIRGNNQFDTSRRIQYVTNLIRRGFQSQILLSHDVCLRSMLKSVGGCGYEYIPKSFLPMLRDAGVEDEIIATIVTDNPRRALTGES